MARVSKKDAIRRLWKVGNLDYKRRSNQIKMRDHILEAQSKIVPILASRRNGKSFEILLECIELCNARKNAIVKYICPRLKMVKTIVNFNMRIILEDCPDEMRPEWKENDKCWVFPNGSEIQFAGTDNGSHENLRGGSADLCVVDEAGFCDHLEYVIKSILRPTVITTGGKIIMISTPSKSSDHEFIQKYILPAKAAGNLLILQVHDNPEISEEDIEEIKSDYPTGDQDPHYRREYLCEIIRDKDSVVVPEFSAEKEREIVKDHPRPEYFDTYVAGDIGFKDLTVFLFGYWDFLQAKLIIEDELVMNGPEMTTEKLAERIKEKEEQLYTFQNENGDDFVKPTFMRVMDNNLIMMNDLNRLHNLNFIASAKDDKEAQVNQVRMMIENDQIIIHPRCKHLIYHLKGASWKQSGRSRIFDNLSDTTDHSVRGGHADALDALIYMVRNLVKSKNPYPKGWGKPKGNDVFYGYYQEIKELGKDENFVNKVKQILNIK